MPLPLGEWIMNANGAQGTLVISAVDVAGRVSGSLNLFSGSEARTIGFWDETSQELTFSIVSVGEETNYEISPLLFKGYLFNTPMVPLAGQDVLWTVTGYFQSLDVDNSFPKLAKATARRNVYGWLAQITVIT